MQKNFNRFKLFVAQLIAQYFTQTFSENSQYELNITVIVEFC